MPTLPGFSIRNGVDGRIWEVGGEILKDAEGVFSERRKARASRGVRGKFWKFWKFGSLRMYFPHSGAWIRLFEQDTDIINFGLFLFNGTQNSASSNFQTLFACYFWGYLPRLIFVYKRKRRKHDNVLSLVQFCVYLNCEVFSSIVSQFVADFIWCKVIYKHETF